MLSKQPGSSNSIQGALSRILSLGHHHLASPPSLAALPRRRQGHGPTQPHPGGPPRPRGTLGLKRTAPSAALASTSFAPPSRVAAAPSPAATTKRARLVLPSQHLDPDDSVPPPTAAADPVLESPATHTLLLSRNASPHTRTASPAPDTSAAGSSRRSGPFYLCTWRKPQAKKHKTWDGDAILIVKDAGERCALICSETGKELVGSARFAHGQLASGDELALGGKEIEVDRQIDEPEYRRLVAFTRGELSPVKKGPPPTAVRTHKPFVAPIKRSAIKPVDINALAPARAETFYGKPAPKPARSHLLDESRVSGLINRARAGRHIPASIRTNPAPSS